MRDPEYERQFLEHVTHAARQSGDAVAAFTRAVKARLHKGGEEYADSPWHSRSLDNLMANGGEEGEDVPAWLVLALQHEDMAQLPDDAAHQVRLLLTDASADAMRLWTRISIARNIVREHLSTPGAQEPPGISS